MIKINKIHQPLLKTMFCAFIGLAGVGCASKPALKEVPRNHFYHAPAQAYNLLLDNPAFYGKVTLADSCNVKGSSLQIRDEAKNYYKIDVINLLANTGFDISDDKEKSADSIAEYYRQLYGSSFLLPPTNAIKTINKSFLYIPLPLDNKGKTLPDGRVQALGGKVVGMLISRNKHALYNVQHVQNIYNEKQMVSRLLSVQNHMNIPGKFPVDLEKKRKKDEKLQIPADGFMHIDPKKASAEEVAKWQKMAKCT